MHPPPSTRHPPPTYRPLSGLAVAGFGLAVVFTTVVVGTGIAALRTGMPLLMGWVLVLAAAAAALSLAGQIQVRRSEGTRAGITLARWGWWLSLVFGLGYASYFFATERAVSRQARDFSEEWFDKLASGDRPTAFHRTLPPAQRKGDNPRDTRRLHARYLLGRDGTKGPWPLFLEQQLVRVVEQAGADARLEYLGNEDWRYEAGGYLVLQNFRLHTLEGVYEFRLPVWGGESRKPEPEFEGRQWYVYLYDPLTVQTVELTPLGKSAQTLRVSAGRFVEDWGRLLREGLVEEAFLATLTDQKRHATVTGYAAGLAAAIGAGGSLIGGWSEMLFFGDLAAMRQWLLPGYAAFAQGDWIVTRNLVAAADAVRQAIQRSLPALFQPRAPEQKVYLADTMRSYDGIWNIDGERLRLFQPIQVHFGSQYYCEGVAELTADDPGLTLQLQRLTQAAREGSPAPPPLPANYQPHWRLAGLELTFGFDLSRSADRR